MTKPAKIPQEEIVRAVRAAKKMGWKSVRIEMNGAAVEVRADIVHIERMSEGHPREPDTGDEHPDAGKFR